MTPPADSRPKRRAPRLVGWALGVVVTVTVLGFLAVAGTVIWLYSVALPNGRAETAEKEKVAARRLAASAQEALTRAAADGTLTAEEIRTTVGGPIWDLQRTDPVWTLRVRFAGTEDLCFAYEITPPPGPQTRVQRTELPSCPAITPGG